MGRQWIPGSQGASPKSKVNISGEGEGELPPREVIGALGGGLQHKKKDRSKISQVFVNFAKEETILVELDLRTTLRPHIEAFVEKRNHFSWNQRICPEFSSTHILPSIGRMGDQNWGESWRDPGAFKTSWMFIRVSTREKVCAPLDVASCFSRGSLSTVPKNSPERTAVSGTGPSGWNENEPPASISQPLDELGRREKPLYTRMTYFFECLMQ